MREGYLKKGNHGCLSVMAWIIIIIFGCVFCWAFFDVIIDFGKKGLLFNSPSRFIASFIFIGTPIGLVYFIIRQRQNKNKPKDSQLFSTPDSIFFQTRNGTICLNNPYRGFFVVGAAGSGKSESIAVPLLSQFINKGFSGIAYDFKFPSLANDIQQFVDANRGVLRHYFLNFNTPLHSDRVNPIHPRYLPNTSYAREYAQAIISNLMKESIKKPDFWSRSATDLLTACIWYLKEEHPDICDLPHVCAMITSNDTALISKLQENSTTAQMTISIYNAMKRGADGQTSGVIGTLQGAIAQINTPELMYIFRSDDFSLDVNHPQAPAVVTIGSYPTLTATLAPLCSLVITVATKLMNQPGKNKSFVLLDEAPTCYIPNLEILPNTGRSNKIATVIMCQDLAQLTDGYGKEKADVLFAACNNHFYGRVASSHTSEILSKQFGKMDRTYVTSSQGKGKYQVIGGHVGESETVQERDIMRPAEFLGLQVGEFSGITVESNAPTFRAQFLPVNRPPFRELKPISPKGDVYGYYKHVRDDINKLLNQSPKDAQIAGKGGILNHTQTNRKGSLFDVMGD